MVVDIVCDNFIYVDQKTTSNRVSVRRCNSIDVEDATMVSEMLHSQFFGIVRLTYVPPDSRNIDGNGACPADMPHWCYPLGGKESFP